MENFKQFVKNENSERRRAKRAQIAEFLDENAGTIFKIFFGLVVVFALLYVIFAKSNQKYDTKITSINMVAKRYVNDSDTTYTMTLQSKELGKFTVDLEKDNYLKYSSAYKKGTNDYLYTDYNGFYFLCLFFVIICVICFFASLD